MPSLGLQFGRELKFSRNSSIFLQLRVRRSQLRQAFPSLCLVIREGHEVIQLRRLEFLVFVGEVRCLTRRGVRVLGQDNGLECTGQTLIRNRATDAFPIRTLHPLKIQRRHVASVASARARIKRRVHWRGGNAPACAWRAEYGTLGDPELEHVRCH